MQVALPELLKAGWNGVWVGAGLLCSRVRFLTRGKLADGHDARAGSKVEVDEGGFRW